MRLPTIVLVGFALLLPAIATPVPSAAVEELNATDISIASSALPPHIYPEFCWIPGAQPVACQVLPQYQGACAYHYGLMNGLKGIRMPDNQFCMVSSDTACSKDSIILGTTEDIKAAGVNFLVLSTWCYDITKGPVKFPPQTKRSINGIESGSSFDSKTTAKFLGATASHQDEGLVILDHAPHTSGTTEKMQSIAARG
ncbi:hypothetical protein FKW77_003979 [Venturia effusa]|uniref:Uncharacterized protein n=1 Tax=Venturia effusa TaxID=50376 RepID=A0A517LMQ1_9PEZI|nr:hypothetical protein FKW77_003979 [Venturia effusa]